MGPVPPRRTRNRRIINNCSPVPIVGEFEIGKRIRAMEVQCRAVRPIADAKYAVRVAVLNCPEINPFEIDLIGAGQRAVTRETQDRAAEGRRLIDFQHAGGGGEDDGCAVSSSNLEGTAGAYACRSRGPSQRLGDFQSAARGNVRPDYSVSIEVLVEDSFQQLSDQLAPDKTPTMFER